jgi:hypothetical protein
MTTFNNREKAAEAKFSHDQETAFKMMARRNKLLGLWVAEHLGLSGDEADAYAREVVKSDFDRPGDEDVFEKVWADLQAKNVDLSEHRVRRHMTELLTEAERQVLEETP